MDNFSSREKLFSGDIISPVCDVSDGIRLLSMTTSVLFVKYPVLYLETVCQVMHASSSVHYIFLSDVNLITFLTST